MRHACVVGCEAAGIPNSMLGIPTIRTAREEGEVGESDGTGEKLRENDDLIFLIGAFSPQQN